ncbi:MAG: hypothetical protein ACD_76C00041G0003 [uncultured bacterium]|nr:MAG: hypothetical protein ACD_76C00041G0003 [uncultured bacterium]HBD05446.1 hypothetical protein [Candidatus Uhrbacteria bacterium]
MKLFAITIISIYAILNSMAVFATTDETLDYQASEALNIEDCSINVDYDDDGLSGCADPDCAGEERCKNFQQPETPQIPYIVPQLNIPIPNLQFSQISTEGGKINVPFLAEYIAAVFQWMLGAGTIFAIVMIMIGGVQWIIGSGTGEIKQAQHRISQAVIGLVLLFGSWVLLNTVNPKLTILSPIKIQQVDPIQYVIDSGESDETGIGASTEELASIGIDCPGSGGDVKTIAMQFKGKTTYRLGAKGQKPPYADTKTCDNGPCKDYCPEGTVCLDCSGFAAVVAKCAGLPSRRESGNSITIFDGAEKITTTSCTSTTVTTESGVKTLRPGDYFGLWQTDYPEKEGMGHIWIYIGDGKVIDSHGGKRASGDAIGIYDLTNICGQYPSIRYVPAPASSGPVDADTDGIPQGEDCNDNDPLNFDFPCA